MLKRYSITRSRHGIGADQVLHTQALQTAALDHFALPGDPAFPLNALYQPPRDRQEAETLRGYISQMRQELAMRLVARLYADGTGKPSKWWLSFTKRRFMGKSL